MVRGTIMSDLAGLGKKCALYGLCSYSRVFKKQGHNVMKMALRLLCGVRIIKRGSRRSGRTLQ